MNNPLPESIHEGAVAAQSVRAYLKKNTKNVIRDRKIENRRKMRKTKTENKFKLLKTVGVKKIDAAHNKAIAEDKRRSAATE